MQNQNNKDLIQIGTIYRLKKNPPKVNNAILIEGMSQYEYCKAYEGYFQFVFGDQNTQGYPNTDKKREPIYVKSFNDLVDIYCDFCENLSIKLTGIGFDCVFRPDHSERKYNEFIQNKMKLGLTYIDCKEMCTTIDDKEGTTVQVAFVFQ